MLLAGAGLTASRAYIRAKRPSPLRYYWPMYHVYGVLRTPSSVITCLAGAESKPGPSHPNILFAALSHPRRQLALRWPWRRIGGAVGAVHRPCLPGELRSTNSVEQITVAPVELPRRLSRQFLHCANSLAVGPGARRRWLVDATLEPVSLLSAGDATG